MKILLTGGAGYIGSHTAVVLQQAGHQVVIYDNFCNSQPDIVQRIAQITSRIPVLVRGDVRQTDLLADTFRQHQIKTSDWHLRESLEQCLSESR